jgi:hypothetical protein
MSPRWVMQKYREGALPGRRLHGSNRTRFWLSEVIETMPRKGGK